MEGNVSRPGKKGKMLPGNAEIFPANVRRGLSGCNGANGGDCKPVVPFSQLMKPTALLLLGLLPLTLGCGAAVETETKAPALKAQWSGQHGGSSTPGVRELRTTDQWQAFWQQVGREPPRVLDPEREMAVAIFVGEKNTGGYGAEIVGARVHEGRLVIDYREISPAPDAMVTQALTAPWAVVILPRSELPVTVNKLNPPRSGLRPEEPGNRPVAPGARAER